ncbi:MAG: hypothetical protein IPQ25_10490 [Chitinophagaceae bacterium]|nr:hypothetical protein [Chitinophagaceae bacterium]
MSAEKYRQKLIAEILIASSEEEVKKFCDTAMKMQNKKKRMVLLLPGLLINWRRPGRFNPRTKNVQQWSNIQTARSYIGIIKQRLSTLQH